MDRPEAAGPRRAGAHDTSAVEVVTTNRGTARVSLPAPHVALITVTGFMEVPMRDAFLAAANRALEKVSRITVFCDYGEMSGYEPAVRSGMEQWADRRKKSGECLTHHILFRSRLVAMGVSVASLFLGDTIKPHTQRTEFDRALDLEKRLPVAFR